MVTKEWKKAKSAEHGICVRFSFRDNPSFRLNSLAPLCLWQCFLFRRIDWKVATEILNDMFQPREKNWFSIVSPNIAVAPRRPWDIPGEWKRDGLLSTPIVGRPQVVAARVETFDHWETLPCSKDPPKHMLMSRSYSAQFFQARFMENIDLLQRRVFHILDPQRASGREEDGVGVPGDFQVILKTPVWGS